MNVGRQLLAEYVRTGSEAAFRELVDRYLNLVHHTARRLVGGDEHRAQDIAQIVFANLARQAAELTPEVQLGGWLHRHTCFVAANQLRGERRRIAREIEAANMNLESDVKPDDFARLAPLLDATINQLPEADRTAIVLRYFEQKDFRSIGQTLAVSDDAARARVNRALDKLQDLLTKQGIPTTAAALGVVLTTQAVTAAPAGLAALITASALAGSSSAAATTLLATTKILAMTTLQKACLTLTVATLAGVGLYEARQAAVWHAQATALQAQL
ncbi:MAG TPA: sigma-70 family RNA polymerase sigma factor, partial [Verrucomicrobiae bacterium]